MRYCRIGILGATGAVGRELIKVLSERDFPVGELRLFASEKSIGKKIKYNKKTYEVGIVKEGSFSNLDFVFGAADAAVSKKYANVIINSGALFIDNSSAFRTDKSVPLIVPEINASSAYLNKGIISNPNCSTIIILTAINAINKISKILKIIVSTYQAASGVGQSGITGLENEIKAYKSGRKVGRTVFPERLFLNVIPCIDKPCESGYTLEEIKLLNESKKILSNDDLKVSATCVRVPVFRSHSMSVRIITESYVGVDRAREAVKNARGCVLLDDILNGVYPTPLKSTGKDAVYVGRIREDLTDENALCLWCSGDQLRKGAATNAVQIAELFVK